MIVLYIFLGLIALLLLLLLLPLRLSLSYREEAFSAEAGYLFLRFPLYPPRESKKDKPSPGEEKKEKPPAPKGKKPSFLDYLGLFNDLIPLVREVLRHTLGRLTLKKCRVRMTVAGEDAAETGIRYGRAHFLIYELYAFLSHHIKIKEWHFEVAQDYLGGPDAETAEAEVLLKILPLTLLSAGLRLLLKGAPAYLDLMKSQNNDAANAR